MQKINIILYMILPILFYRFHSIGYKKSFMIINSRISYPIFGCPCFILIVVQQVATWSGHKAKVNSLLLFGEHILSVDAAGNLFIWAFKEIEQNLSPIGHIILDNNFTPTCMMHPDTYLNKVIHCS